ncbi:MAG: hypothetical protein OXU21_11255 [Chloroflexota bacterium]|nr:hypothetical protein [Chloroflexota bacterium]
MRRLAAALLVAGALACGCTQGFMLEDGERPAGELTDAKFVFAEGQTEIEMKPAPTSLEPTPTPSPTPAPTPTPALAPRSTASPATAPADRPTTPVGRSEETERPTPTLTESYTTGAEFEGTPPVTATVAAGPLDIQAIAANPLASTMLIPNQAVDPGLETFEETSDPGVVFAPEIFAGFEIVSFGAKFSGRQPESGALSERQRLVQLVQFVFVHPSVEGAASFYEFLSSSFIGSSAATRVEAMQEPYPNLESSLTGFGNVPQIADAVTLAVLEMDPNLAAGAPPSGPAVPTIYYIVLQVGRMTGVIEVVYLVEQDPEDVLIIGNVMVSLVPPELRPSAAP